MREEKLSEQKVFSFIVSESEKKGILINFNVNDSFSIMIDKEII